MDEILHCIGCRQGCWSHLLANKPISCLVNPLTGKEGEYAIKEADEKKKVMIIGGGPVGMEAAIVAAKRGHDVTIYDKSDRLGGQWLQAAVPPGKELLNTLTVWQKGELERSGAKIKLIATDGVFSMDGIIADLKGICDLAEKYNALVMVDDSHAVGFMGLNGRGTPEYCGVEGRVDIITRTLGKALGGASGGYTTGHKEIIDWLRQRSRPYLFSNSLAPIITTVSIKVIEMLEKSEELRVKLNQNSRYFRREMEKLEGQF